MPEGFNVGNSLNDAAARLELIVTTLQPAYDVATDVSNRISFESIYEGAARSEMEAFYKKYVDDLENMIYYYGLAKEYVVFVTQTAETADAQLAQAVL